MTRISLIITLCFLLCLPLWPVFGQAVLVPPPLDYNGQVQVLLHRLDVQDVQNEQGCINAATQLGKMTELAAVQPLCKLLPIADTQVRLAVIAALGEIGDTLAVEPLLALLHDADQRVCLAVIDALGKIGDTRAVAPLTEQVKTESGEKRRLAITALGQIGDARSAEVLIDVLTRHTESSVRCSTADALGTLRDPRAIDPLLALAHDPDAALRSTVITALGKFHDPRVVEPLIDALRDTLTTVKIAAANAPVHDTRCIDPLLALLHDQDAAVRNAAIHRLATYRAPNIVEPLCALLHDQDANISESAIVALGEIGDARAVPPLLACLQTALPQRAIIEALGNLGDTRAIDPLLALCDGKDEQLRYFAFEALSRLNDRRLIEPMLLAIAKAEDADITTLTAYLVHPIGSTLQRIGQPAVETMLSWLTEKDPVRRQAAARASKYLPDARAVPLLAALLHDTDEKVRLVAVSALSRIGDRQAVVPLLEVVKDAGATAELRTAAFEALAQFDEPGITGPALAAMKDKEATVRCAAIHALPDPHDPRVRAPLQEALQDNAEVCKAAMSALLDTSDGQQLLPLLRVAAKYDLEGVLLDKLPARMDASTVDALCSALEEKDVLLRQCAGMSLETMGFEAFYQMTTASPVALHRAVEPLLRHTDDPDPEVRREVIGALSYTRDPRALPAIQQAVMAKELNIRLCALRGLERFPLGDPAPMLQLMAPLLKDDDTQVRDGAAQLLEKIQEAKPEAPERHQVALLLLPYLTDPDPTLRHSVMLSLSSTSDPLALETLCRLLNNQQSASEAASALNKFSDPRAADALIAALHVHENRPDMLSPIINALTDYHDARIGDALAALESDEETAYNAALALGGRKDPRAVPTLLAWLASNHQSPLAPPFSSWQGEQTVLLLAGIGDRRAVDPLIAVLHGAELDLRADAAYALGRLKDPRAVEPLIAALLDPCLDSSMPSTSPQRHTNVCAEAANALGEIGDPRAVTPLLAALSAGSMPGRQAAAEALGKLKDPRAIDPLISALTRLNRAGNKAVAAALKALTGQDFGTDAARWRAWREGK